MTAAASLPKDDNEIWELTKPMWNNITWNRYALGIWQSSGEQSDKLNETNFGFFFGCFQHMAINFAVIGICKLYDDTNKRYEKHTLPNLQSKLESFFEKDKNAVLRVREKDLHQLGLEENVIKDNMTLLSKDPLSGIKTLRELLDGVIPNDQNNDTLKHLKDYRNKIGTHQEIINDKAIKERLSYLPPIDDIEKLNKYAHYYLGFYGHLFSTSTIELYSSIPCPKMATKNIIKKLLSNA